MPFDALRGCRHSLTCVLWPHLGLTNAESSQNIQKSSIILLQDLMGKLAAMALKEVQQHASHVGLFQACGRHVQRGDSAKQGWKSKKQLH